MTVFSALYAVHVLAALVWVGGMFFAWMILRPAAVSSLEAPARLTLWAEVLRRFFLWVWLAVVLLPISGVGLLHLRFAGLETAPRYVQIMMGLYLAMLALFLLVQLLQLPGKTDQVMIQGPTTHHYPAHCGNSGRSTSTQQNLPGSSWRSSSSR